MENSKTATCLLVTLILLTCTMFVWTISYISASNSKNIPTAIAAFNA